MPAFRIPVGAAAALAIISLLAFLMIIPLRRENAELRAKVTELEQGTGALREQAAAAERLQSEIAAAREENDRLRQVEAALRRARIAARLAQRCGGASRLIVKVLFRECK